MNATPTTTATTGAAPQGGAAWGIVAKREMLVMLTDKAFWISTLTTIGIIILGGILGTLWGGGAFAEPSKVAVATDDAAAVVALAKSQGVDVEAVRVDAANLTSSVENGDAKSALEFRDGGWMLSAKSPADAPALDAAVREFQIGQNAAQMGVDAKAIQANTTLTKATVGGDDAKGVAVMIATMAFAILFMLSATSYGYQIAQSVVTEKESRIVEILAAAIRIRHLLTGKVIANTVMAIGQVILFISVALIGLSFTEARSLVGIVAPIAGWFVLFFLVGFASLACLWAAAGSMATRMQDVGQTTMPLMMIVMLTYMSGFFAQGHLAEVLSYVPIASTVIMPGRLLSGEATWVNALIALLIAVAFMAGCIWAGERIYRRGLLQTGSVLKLRDAFAPAA